MEERAQPLFAIDEEFCHGPVDFLPSPSRWMLFPGNGFVQVEQGPGDYCVRGQFGGGDAGG
jgi:hypothetical protein